MKQFKKGEGPLYLIDDSKLYDQKTINGLTEFPFITRIPRTIKQERICIDDALQIPFIQWEAIDKQSAYVLILHIMGLIKGGWSFIQQRLKRG